MKCHAGVEFPSGQSCPKCHAKLGEVCWPGINSDLLEVVELRKENERLRATLEIIAGSATDKLQAMRAKAALDNIGPAMAPAVRSTGEPRS